MATLPSGLPELVGDDEDLARFLTHSGHFNSTMAKPAVILPNPKDRERSMFRHGGQPREGLWQIARDYVVKDGQTLCGAAVVKARRAREVLLEVRANARGSQGHRDPTRRHRIDLVGSHRRELAACEAQGRQVENQLHFELREDALQEVHVEDGAHELLLDEPGHRRAA